MKRKKHFKMTTTRIIVLGFLIGSLIGSFLLWLPISSKEGKMISYIDALFMATSSLCVIGLTPVVTVDQWSYFGQAVILFLVQFGGLGVVTFTTTVLLLLGKRITLSERMLIQEAYNLESISGVVKLTIRIVKGTILVETIGALLYSFVFIPEYGVLEGIWKSIFHSVSAFCNAGIDIIGDSSFIGYQTNIIINVVTMLLVILGGIGFPVWWDIVRVGNGIIKKDISWRDAFRKTMLHTKVVLTVTGVLIFGGAVLIFLFEYTNPETIGNLSFGNKIMASLFESVTLRTAGFQTISQEYLTQSSNFLALILMFIGGSPSGTAGGVKTVTMVILLLSMMAAIRGDNEVTIFHRKITSNYVRRSIAIIIVSAMALLVVCMALSITEDAGFLEILFEGMSAIATVGMTRGMTSNLTIAGKSIVIFGMYVGRLSPMTMALAFNTKRYEGKKTMAEGKVIVG